MATGASIATTGWFSMAYGSWRACGLPIRLRSAPPIRFLLKYESTCHATFLADRYEADALPLLMCQIHCSGFGFIRRRRRRTWPSTRASAGAPACAPPRGARAA